MTLAAALVVSLWFAATAQADDGRAARRVVLLPRYQQECSGCHLAFPPGLLPAASWRRLMGDLAHHFGTDASLDAAAVQEIDRWLQTTAAGDHRARRDPAAPPEDRITRSAWFQRKHREIATATWQRPAVKSPSNCAACHTRAEQGDFDEHSVRIPR